MVARNLFLLRHATASWDHGGSDHERPLDERGRRACALLASYLADREVVAQLVLCSSAVRARQTLDGILAALPDDLEVTVSDDLYLAATADLLGVVRALPDTTTSVLVIGHNPGLGDLAELLAGDGDRATLAALRDGFPAGGLAHLCSEGAWAQVEPGRVTVASFVRPHELA